MKQIIMNGDNRQRLQFICEEIFTGRTPVYDFDNEVYKIIGQKNNQKGIINIDEPKYAAKYFHDNNPTKYFLKKGDILLNSLGGGSVGRIGYFDSNDNDVLTDGHPIVFRTNKLNNKKFVYYALLNEQKQFEDMAVGSTNQCFLNVSDVYHFEINCPSLQEQIKIANYLDSKCSEIDALTKDIEKQIEVLEDYKKSVITEAVTKGLNPNISLVNSRVYYMAPYNSNWELSKIGYECTKLSRLFNSNDYALICSNKGKVLLRPLDMSGKMVSEDNAMQGIKKGDIAIHGMDTWHGAIALSNYSGKITRVVHVCDSKQDKRFIVYYLRSLAFNGVYKLISNGVRGNTSDFRSWDKVANIYISFPNIEEQKEICDYLDDTEKNIDHIIIEKQRQIEMIESYKKSLIYEYVTGKKEVIVE